ncbi:MAG: nicotinamide-nucleotide amidohydrolase family protein [Chitinophagaceae bacterium]
MPKKIINASIITIGDELLIGQTIDTNSAFIGQELNKIGVWVKRRVAVGDVYGDIWNALDEESKQSDIIIITGGLGPTADDITKPLLCKYFGGNLVVNEKVLAHVKYLFEIVFRRKGPMLESNLRQAEVPDNCIVLHNARGSAPGMWFGPSAPLPPKGGDSNDKSAGNSFSYQTADPMIYGLLKDFVSEHRANPTEAEKALWQVLRGKKLAGYKFRRQHIIDSFIADFICLPEKLIIEVDGLIHQLPENKISDQERTEKLKRFGFDVLRFTNNQVLYETEDTLKIILLALTQKSAELPISKIPPLGGGGAVFISLPGVPHEMKGLLVDEVIPRLLKEFDMPAIVHRTAFTAGQGESMLAEMLKDFEPTLPAHIKLAYLPNYGMVKLRLTARGDSKGELEKELAPYFNQLLELVKDFLVSNEDEGLEVVIGKILKEKGKNMGTAESCTGGYIAHLLTSIPGSSAYFEGSVVAYSYDIKERLLNVDHETLNTVGAVSEETVRQMVTGALKALQVDYVLAVSGIMGPGGGTDEKPVGTVWIAAGNKEKTETVQFHLRFNRQRNISMTAGNALNFLRKFILKN